MIWEWFINFVLPFLTFIALIFYAYFTYLIAKDVYEPFVSFSFNQFFPSSSDLGFHLINKSKVEIEVYGKLLLKLKESIFEDKKGFYGNETSWILQPFTEGNGHIELKNLTNKNGVKLEDFIKENKTALIEFTFQIKYRKVGSIFWKKSSQQNFKYDFGKGLMWSKV